MIYYPYPILLPLSGLRKKKVNGNIMSPLWTHSVPSSPVRHTQTTMSAAQSLAVGDATGAAEEVCQEIANFTGVPPVQARAIFKHWSSQGQLFLRTTANCEKHEVNEYKHVGTNVWHYQETYGTRGITVAGEWAYGCRYSQAHKVCRWGELTVQEMYDFERMPRCCGRIAVKPDDSEELNRFFDDDYTDYEVANCTEVETPKDVRCAVRVAREGEMCVECAIAKHFPTQIQDRVHDSRDA